MITRDEILKGRENEYPLSEELEANLEELLFRMNIIRKAYDKPMIVTSGYRPGHYNKAAGGAKHSPHLVCRAVDIRDENGELAEWCLRNIALIEEVGLCIENPKYTPTWVHFDTIPRAKIIFNP